ncbi:MAG: CoA synthetase, partial [Rhizobiaceae bacterium]
FISAPGVSEEGIHRPGGPHALVTSLCVFIFDKTKARFRLESTHPGHTLEEVLDNTGFEFDYEDNVGETPAPDPEKLVLLQDELSAQIADPYPLFAKRVWG